MDCPLIAMTYSINTMSSRAQVIVKEQVVLSCHKCCCLLPQMLLSPATHTIHQNRRNTLMYIVDEHSEKRGGFGYRYIVEYYSRKPHCLAAAVSKVLPIKNNVLSQNIIAARAKERQGTRTDICQNSDKSSDVIDTKKELARIAGAEQSLLLSANKQIGGA